MPARMLGKKPAKYSHKTPLFANYIRKALPPIPTHINWGGKVSPNGWGMMLNDSEGDCTCACCGHMEMVWTSQRDVHPTVIPDAGIQSAYIAVTGEEGNPYNPVTGDNDNGCAIIDVLNYWMTTGIGGTKIQAYTSINPQNQSHIQAAIYLGGAVDIGVNLPLTAQTQVNAGQPWTVTSTTGDGAPGSWGGHSIPLISFTPTGPTCVTWGSEQAMTWDWFFTYCDEAYFVLSHIWTTNGSIFNDAALLADMQAVKN